MADKTPDVLASVPSPHVMVLQLNRPEVRNALRTRTLKEIAEILAAAEADDQIRVCVIAGSDRAFAAGADIRELAALDEVTAREDPRPEYWRRIRDFSKPLVAAVTGYALGAGCELALLADMIVASEDAVFGQPEIRLGIIPGAGGIQRLTRIVGKPLAMKLVLTGAHFTAHEAYAAGMISELAPTGRCLERAIELAREIADKAPLAVVAAKRVVNLSYETSLSDGLAIERDAFCSLMDTEDKKEGLTAFLEKRSANFIGR